MYITKTVKISTTVATVSHILSVMLSLIDYLDIVIFVTFEMSASVETIATAPGVLDT